MFETAVSCPAHDGINHLGVVTPGRTESEDADLSAEHNTKAHHCLDKQGKEAVQKRVGRVCNVDNVEATMTILASPLVRCYAMP